MKQTSPIVFLVDVDDTLLYIHKEEALIDIAQRYPAEHYVLVDDKLRILTAVKQAWGKRVTTVFPRQGEFALNLVARASYPPADISVERISDLLEYDLSDLLLGRERSAKDLRPSATAPTLN